MSDCRRASAALVLLLGLSGCNNVVSMEPWFSAADTQGVPEFREGLWLSVSEDDCRVDESRPAERWPACATATFVRGSERLVMEWEEPTEDRSRRRTFLGWRSERSLVSNGDPLVGQADFAEIATPAPETSPDQPESEEQSWRYWYYAIRATRFDERGRVVAFESWPVQCGPITGPVRTDLGRIHIPADEEIALSDRPVTDRPFPGLTMAGDNCIAANKDVVRQAARLSEAIAEHSTARWIRDGWR